MLKSFVAFAFMGLLMSFVPQTDKEEHFFKHIDMTLTSSQGCTFHIVGEATINMWKFKLTALPER